MTWNEALPLLLLGSSFLPGLIIFFLHENRRVLRTTLNLFGATVKLVLIGYMLWGLQHDESYVFRYPILPNVDLLLHADSLAMLFVTLSAALWFLTTLYAIGYLEGSPNRNRFFGFFSICVTATVGIAMSGNLFTFFFFYELLTLSTYPLVVHHGSDDALRAGNVYLAYTLVGGAVLLTGIVWLYGLTGSVEFRQGGIFSERRFDETQLRVIFLLLIIGLGVKAAIVPLHGWLPRAMVAPAPVSALLHAVAVVKAGAFGIVRIVYEVYGIEFSFSLGLLLPLAIAASVTIIWGSLRAIWQDDLKRRLAYSTISQVSYIVLGIAILGPVATIGGLVHLVHQGIMKITLFFCAGNFAETLGVHKVSEMNGIGRHMPLTMAAFTVAALGMAGMPMTAGYVSKKYLTTGAELAGMEWAHWVLTLSSVLNALYFLPILYRGWLKPSASLPSTHSLAIRGKECSWFLLVPPLISATATVVVAIGAYSDWSPLYWAKLIAHRQYPYLH